MPNRRHLGMLSLVVLLLAVAGALHWSSSRAKDSVERAEPLALTVVSTARAPVVAPQPVRPSGVPRAAIAPSAPAESEVRTRVHELAATIASLIHAHLYEGEAGRELRDCAPRESGRCQELLSAALYEVLAQHIEADLVAGKLGAAEIESLDPELVHAAAAELLERSPDPVVRVSMLALLARATELRPLGFPSTVYLDLSRKPVVEAQLLLGRSAFTGLPDSKTVDEVGYLAAREGVDPRVQGMALAALARPSTADSLKSAVRALAQVHGPAWDGWRSNVAMALGMCGEACADVTAEVVAMVPEPSELALYVLRLMPRAERGAMLPRLAPMLSERTLEQLRHELDE